MENNTRKKVGNKKRTKNKKFYRGGTRKNKFIEYKITNTDKKFYFLIEKNYTILKKIDENIFIIEELQKEKDIQNRNNKKNTIFGIYK